VAGALPKFSPFSDLSASCEPRSVVGLSSQGEIQEKTVVNQYQEVMDANRANIQASVKLAAKSLEGANRVIKRSLEVATTIAKESVEILKPNGPSGEPGDILAGIARSREFYGKQLERCVELWCESVDIGAEAQSELARLIRDNVNMAAKAATAAGAAFASDAARARKAWTENGRRSGAVKQ
jgi:phasin protein